jgi:hypothetical protein
VCQNSSIHGKRSFNPGGQRPASTPRSTVWRSGRETSDGIAGFVREPTQQDDCPFMPTCTRSAPPTHFRLRKTGQLITSGISRLDRSPKRLVRAGGMAERAIIHAGSSRPRFVRAPPSGPGRGSPLPSKARPGCLETGPDIPPARRSCPPLPSLRGRLGRFAGRPFCAAPFHLKLLAAIWTRQLRRRPINHRPEGCLALWTGELFLRHGLTPNSKARGEGGRASVCRRAFDLICANRRYGLRAPPLSACDCRCCPVFATNRMATGHSGSSGT